MPVTAVGSRVWVIAEGYIPAWSNGPAPEFTSHETALVTTVAYTAAGQGAPV